MVLWGLHRRRTRYPVCWDATLEVRFSDYQGQIPVTVAHFSSKEAIIHSEQIFLNRRHLIAMDQKPNLKLKIALPEGNFESTIQIQWYKWCYEKNQFEIGINFCDILTENHLCADKIVKNLRRQACSV